MNIFNVRTHIFLTMNRKKLQNKKRKSKKKRSIKAKKQKKKKEKNLFFSIFKQRKF